MIYKCVCDTSLPIYNENGRQTNEYISIGEGTYWKVEDTDYRFVRNRDTIRLTSVVGNHWLEVSRDFLDNYCRITPFTDTVRYKHLAK